MQNKCWDAIKSRFCGNDESKKMQKYILKQQFEGFSVSNTEGLHKGYDRFQSLLSQLEIHRAGVDSLSFDDLYNNLRVFESDIKGSTASSSSPQNVAFVSENTSSTNDVSTAYSVPNLSVKLKGILLESVESRELKITGRGMHGILETRMGAELDRRRILKHCSDYQTQRFVTAYGMHVVPPPMTGNYMPSGPDIEVDYSQFTYGPKQTQPSESESNSKDEYVSIPTKEQETPSFANQQVKTPRETIKNHLNHLIRDCDFHEKRMARKAELNNGWNNV
ncbi:hypothetical protein Tco_0811899 [Tanacetum coccineum]